MRFSSQRGLVALSTLVLPFHVAAQQAGSIVVAGDTVVSAMMMFLGNEKSVYIMDKVEDNPARIANHPAWGSYWDIDARRATPMDIKTNIFCASGMHLPNGSYVTFGGNGAIGPGGNIGSVNNGFEGSFDQTYQDFDGRKAIRILNPCLPGDDLTSPQCAWYDNPATHSMQKNRWYSAAEPLADGTIALIGGFVNGGYINRNYPNVDPTFEGGAAEPTYEFFPSRGPATNMAFMTKTSGLNSYAHTFLMPSGKMFVQANISTILWDPNTNQETPLPDMPNNIARVYPASGAVAMLPLTPDNNYLPTILFCGGTSMRDDEWGDYKYPAINTFYHPSSNDCQRITPEPVDGSPAQYVQDDNMLDPRTMGQFIILPDGTLLLINGARNGTAGYAQATGQIQDYGQMPYGMSLASDPVFTPAIYDPRRPQGKRWSNAGLDASTIPRMYHSSAMLLPDGSVLVAGSNPNVDYNVSTIYSTEYRAEIFYPSYFSGTKPTFTGAPDTLTYGGQSFDLSMPSTAYGGEANDAASNTTVVIIRPGFTTHAMNMGQRFLQLNNTFSVGSDGTITLHVAQLPSAHGPELFQPGPALLFVVVNGVPSVGKMVTVGSGKVEQQPRLADSILPASVRASGSVRGSGQSNSTNTNGEAGGSTKISTGVLVGAIVAGVAAVAIIGALIGVCLAKRRRARQSVSSASGLLAPQFAEKDYKGHGGRTPSSPGSPGSFGTPASPYIANYGGAGNGRPRASESSAAFQPLVAARSGTPSANASTASLGDQQQYYGRNQQPVPPVPPVTRGYDPRSGYDYDEYDPYAQQPAYQQQQQQYGGYSQPPASSRSPPPTRQHRY